MKVTYALLVLLAPIYLGAQVTGNSTEQLQGSAKVDLPSAKVTFSDPKTSSPLELPSTAMNGPPVCGLDGRSFIQFLTPPPYYNKRVVYSISDTRQVVHYPVEQIVGLSDVWVISTDPGITSAVVLFHAVKVGAPVHSPNIYYMALFDYDGKLRDYVNLDIGFEPVQAVQLTDDRFFVLGSDVIQGRARFVLVDRGGTLVRDLSEVPFMPADNDLKEMLGSLSFAGMTPNDLPLSRKIPIVLSLFRPVHSSRGLLLLEPGSGARVIEIPSVGESRVVKLKLPSNQLAHSVLTAKGRWFVRTSVQGSDTQWNLLEVDPNTGQALRWIDTSGVPASSIACATDSGFYALRWIDHKPYLMDGQFQ